jgi:arabinogalactan endo-1,4-beta-galactosidase
MNKILIVLTLCLATGFVCAQNEPYVLGADISWMQQRENERVKYYRNGQEGDLLSILKGVGFNYIRLRLFVDPKAKDPNVPNDASGWNPYPYSTAGYCGLDSTIKVAKRVKAAGMKFLLDFHYSDTWADPGKQYKPVSWQSLNTVALLTEKVRTYTKESLQAFKDAGVLPDMVQVGNEVVHGMIHPEGKNNGDAFARLVLAGINGVKDVNADIKIMMHTINSENPLGWFTTLKSNLNKIEANAANKIDVIGLSYYPKWHGNVDSLKRVMNAISKNHNIKIAVAEYADWHREVNDAVYTLPENEGFGTFAWEPQEFSGDDSKPLFDYTNGARRSNARLELYPIMAIDYAPSSSSSNTPSSSSNTPSSSSSIQSSSSNTPSSSSSIQSSSSNDPMPISVSQITKATSLMLADKTIILKNLPSNAKIEVYNLQGKQIYSTHSENSQILKIPVQTKGVYIIKIRRSI